MRCLALFTGGLDSQIATRLMQRQRIEVTGIYVQTPFTPSFEAAKAVAARLQIELQRIEWHNDYLPLLQRPRFGFAEAMAPCLDCRIGMVQRVMNLLKLLGASFVISGEVVGQRPSSLRSRDLETIAVHGGANDLLLRPLSAKLLPPTLPEQNGWVDRSQLLNWHGRGRKEQLQLAREWNLIEEATHSPGCLLLEPTYAARLQQLLKQNPAPPAWHLATLQLGRHFDWQDAAHIVVAKNETEAAELHRFFKAADGAGAVLLEPADFRGPSALVSGETGPEVLPIAASLLARFGKNAIWGKSTLRVNSDQQRSLTLPITDVGGEATAWTAGRIQSET